MKDKSIVAVLALFLGGLGVHRFYLNQPVLGILYLLFSWTFIPLIIAFIDFVVFILMSKQSFDIKYNKIKSYNQPSKPKETEATAKTHNGRKLNFLSYEEYMAKQSILNEPRTDEEIILTYDEVIKFMNEFVKPESKEWQITRVNKFNDVAKEHRCSIHRKPIEYGFEIEGLTVNLHIENKCCEISLIELKSKF